MRVSIITAYYYGRKYMRDYIKMIIKNAARISKEDSIEVIIVNDSPRDNFNLEELSDIATDLLVSKFKVSLNAKNNLMKIKYEGGTSEFRIITNEENVGIHMSRIRGLDASTGDYIIFLDQDDLLGKSAISTYIDNASFTDEVLVSNAALGQRVGHLKWYRSAYHTKRIGDIDCYCNVGIQIISPGHTCIYKKAIPKEWTEYICTYNGADDYFLWLLMLSKGVEFKYIDKVLYLHRYTGSNLSADTTVTDASTMEFCNYLKEIDYFPDEYVDKLKKMIEYKATFRVAAKGDKVYYSLKNWKIFSDNIGYKIMTRTPLGFNR